MITLIIVCSGDARLAWRKTCGVGSGHKRSAPQIHSSANKRDKRNADPMPHPSQSSTGITDPYQLHQVLRSGKASATEATPRTKSRSLNWRSSMLGLGKPPLLLARQLLHRLGRRIGQHDIGLFADRLGSGWVLGRLRRLGIGLGAPKNLVCDWKRRQKSPAGWPFVCSSLCVRSGSLACRNDGDELGCGGLAGLQGMFAVQAHRRPFAR
jgi:hypothetical protein